MAKIKQYKIFGYEEKYKEVYVVDVPSNSIYLDIKALNDGIYVFYQVPELVVEENIFVYFKIIKPNASIPNGYVCIKLLDTVMESKGQQVVIIHPIYTLKNDNTQSSTPKHF